MPRAVDAAGLAARRVCTRPTPGGGRGCFGQSTPITPQGRRKRSLEGRKPPQQLWLERRTNPGGPCRSRVPAPRSGIRTLAGGPVETKYYSLLLPETASALRMTAQVMSNSRGRRTHFYQLPKSIQRMDCRPARATVVHPVTITLGATHFHATFCPVSSYLGIYMRRNLLW